MKTLTISLADIEGVPFGSPETRTFADVEVRYTGPIALTDGTVIPQLVKSERLPNTGTVQFEVYASDDPQVATEYHGFAIVVEAEVRRTVGFRKKATFRRTVKVIESMTGTVKLGELPPAEGLPAKWISVDDFAAELTSHAQTARDAAQAAADDAAAAASDADEAVLLAQQAQAASLEVPDANMAAAIGNPATQTRAALEGVTPTVSANFHGASPEATWEQNRDAFQSANDAAAAAGGGRVIADPGVYECKGVIQDSRVQLYLPGVTLRSPDGLAPDVIAGRVKHVAAITNTGSADAYVVDSADITAGVIVGVECAGGMLDTQFTTLTASIDATQTTGIELAQTSGFPSSGRLQVGSEVIRYTGRSGGELLGVERGAQGTVAASHLATDFIGVARHLYAEVVEVVGPTTLRLSEPAALGVDSTLTYGAMEPSVHGLTIDANKAAGGAPSSTAGFSWDTVRRGTATDLTVRNGDHGGFMLKRGATDCKITNLTLIDCGLPDIGKGSAFWMFQGCKANRVSGLTIEGETYVGVYLDDRTNAANGWDAPCDDNVITGVRINTPEYGAGFPAAINIVGSNRNYVGIGSISGPNAGVSVAHGGQGITPEGDPTVPATGNEVASLYLDVRNPWILESSGNKIHDVDFSSRAAASPLLGAGNFAYAVKLVVGGPMTTEVTFAKGTVGEPGIRFTDDPDTGVFNYGPGSVSLIHNATLGAIFRQGEVDFPDGYNLDFGQGAGSRIGFAPDRKLAFWNGTPNVQPANIPDTNGASVAALESEVNELKALMRRLGLTASS